MGLSLDEARQIIQGWPGGHVRLDPQPHVGLALTLGEDPGVAAGGELLRNVVVTTGGVHVNARKQELGAGHGVFLRQSRVQARPRPHP